MKDLAKCSACQNTDPMPGFGGRIYTKCEPCYEASFARRKANREAKAARFTARMRALA